MDFALLPPEVNSGRMYAGAGPGPMLAAAAAWESLAAELHTAAASYGTVIADLGADWNGPSSAAMAASVAPYVQWMSMTAQQAEEAGAQAAAAAAAYEAAFAAHVPPPVIAANRSLLMVLVATNFLGQNTPAIAATEAHYAEMWAQDAGAMYGYAGAAASATRLSPFAVPPKTTNEAGLAAQSTAAEQSAASSTSSNVAQVLSAVPGALHSAAASPVMAGTESMTGSMSTFMGNITGAYSPVGSLGNMGTGWLTSMQILSLAQNVPGVASLLGGPSPITGALGPLSGGYISWQAPVAGAAGIGPMTVSSVSAAAGQSATVGSLSVPSSWASAAPAMKSLPVSLASSSVANAASTVAIDSTSPMFAEMALSSLAGRAMGGTAVRAVAAGGTRVIDQAPDTEALTTATILVIPVGEEELL